MGPSDTGGSGQTLDSAPALAPPHRRWSAQRQVAVAACLFAGLGLALQCWRLQALVASYDQGIFLQVFWNSLRGHPFESTLSSQLSAAVVHQHQLPALGYARLGQHFTPSLLLWMPLLALVGPLALPVVQVGLLTAAGLVLHRLAQHRLEPALAARLAISYFGANAVLGPMLGNFTDLCQLPLTVFLLLLGLQRQRWWLVVLAALLMPLIREDTGVVLVGIALWLALRQRHRWRLALALGLYGAAWVVLVTNVWMPLFSADSSQRFMVENFGHFVAGRQEARSAEVLVAVLDQPLALLRELVSPPGATLMYLLAQTLPLAFVPLVSLDSWLLMGLPLAGLLLARGKPSPLSVNVRYALLVVPGVFAGAVAWWERHGALFRVRRWRALWSGALTLSLLFTVLANPNRSLSWAIPDSLSPWIYTPPGLLWNHGQAARRLLAQIPPQEAVAATTPLVPLVAQRPVVTRFPRDWRYRDRQGGAQAVDWIAVDLFVLQREAPVAQGDPRELRRVLALLTGPESLLAPASGSPAAAPGATAADAYGLVALDHGVVLLHRGAASDPALAQPLAQELARCRALIHAPRP